MTLKEMYEARFKANKDQTELNDSVQARDGVYTEEEQCRWDEADKDWKSLTDQIKRAEELRRRESILNDTLDEHVEQNLTPQGEDRKVGNIVDSEEYRDLFGHYCRTGEMTAEFRHMQGEAGGDSGGYAVTPQTVLAGIWEKARSDFFVRNHARVISVPTAESLGVITLETRPAVPGVKGEITQADAETSLALGKRQLTPHRKAEYIYLSNQLLRQSFEAMAPWITDQFSYQFNYQLEDDYLNGNGAQRALGVFTASADGISTGRDYSTGNTISAIVADNIMGNYYNLSPRYRNMARWLMPTAGIRQVRQAKGGDGQYLWRDGLNTGDPDTLMGKPVDESELAPSTFSTGKYVGIFADWSHYVIADAMNFQMKRLEEIRALYGQTAFVGEIYTDGMPVHEEAFTRITLG